MNKQIMITAGFTEEVKAVEEGKCPFCKEPIWLRDFKDVMSLKEYRISGMCQCCQDETFSEPEE